jgi:hypothetical protein
MYGGVGRVVSDGHPYPIIRSCGWGAEEDCRRNPYERAVGSYDYDSDQAIANLVFGLAFSGDESNSDKRSNCKEQASKREKEASNAKQRKCMRPGSSRPSGARHEE